MLNLFKLPFWGRNNDHENLLPGQHLAQGVLRNFLARTNGRDTSGELEKEVQKCLDAEFQSLHDSLHDAPADNQYQLIQSSLRRIDDRLKDLRR